MGQMSRVNPTAGIQQIGQLLAVEQLGVIGENGHVEPQLATKWVVQNSGRSLLVTLRPGVRFHDNSPFDPATVATILPEAIRSVFGSIAEDIDHVNPVDRNSIDIEFRRPSPFLAESLEVPIRKGAGIGTGPFLTPTNGTTELQANSNYYLGQPGIRRIQLDIFPSIRTAWAELLRGNIDMLWEVGPDALDSLESSTSVATFKYTRQYQYAIAFNRDAPALKSAAVRQALNLAVDRRQLVQRALKNHGVPSSGPVWPLYWAVQPASSDLQFDSGQAAAMLAGKGVRFTLLIPGDEIYERIALELKRQFALVGADMDIRSAPVDELFSAQRTHKYEAVLTEAVSGPTMLRLYVRWHSHGAYNPGSQGNATVDAAFERIRHADGEQAFREAVIAVKRAFMDDPPAIFLAWSERARAISTRFAVPAPKEGRDVLTTLRLWTPRNGSRVASRN